MQATRKERKGREREETEIADSEEARTLAMSGTPRVMKSIHHTFVQHSFLDPVRVQCGGAMSNVTRTLRLGSRLLVWMSLEFLNAGMVIKATPEQASGTTESPMGEPTTSLLCKTEDSLGSLIHEPSLSHLTLMTLPAARSSTFCRPTLPLSLLRPPFYLTTELPAPISLELTYSQPLTIM
ncbi:hypothetical protein NMY22_g3803 [Coprinellus aureogranulatus]|nr:hypothetical protein NMY22_g3803 [Coprinellus aureogranulatus]